MWHQSSALTPTWQRHLQEHSSSTVGPTNRYDLTSWLHVSAHVYVCVCACAWHTSTYLDLWEWEPDSEVRGWGCWCGGSGYCGPEIHPACHLQSNGKEGGFQGGGVEAGRAVGCRVRSLLVLSPWLHPCPGLPPSLCCSPFWVSSAWPALWLRTTGSSWQHTAMTGLG